MTERSKNKVKVFLDGVEIDTAGKSLADILNDIKKKVVAEGKVIIQLKADGRNIDEEKLLLLDDVKEVELFSKNIRELVIEALTECERYIPVLSNGLKVIADALDENENDKALKLLGQATEGIGWIVQVIQNAQILLQLNDSEIGDGKLSDVKKEVVEVLESIVPYLKEGRFDDLSFELRERLSPVMDKLLIYVDDIKKIASLGIQ